MRALLARLGPGDEPRLAGVVRVLLASGNGLEPLAADPDRHVALAALQWLGHIRENAGDPAGASEAVAAALELVDRDGGPWLPAMLHTQSAELAMQFGDRATAREHARAALPVMDRLGATDDAVQLRSLLVLCAIADGRLAEAQVELERISAVGEDQVFGGAAVRHIGGAELALARGDHRNGLRLYRECAASMDEIRLPGAPATGLEPWTTFGYATALTAHAHYATGADVEHGHALFTACRDRAERLFATNARHLDFPAAGLVLFGLGAWLLLRTSAHEPALRLLVLADRFAYNRTVPTMAWERTTAHADPGRLAAMHARYAGRRAPELLDAARAAVTGAACSS
jgi:hypothetical protein